MAAYLETGPVERTPSEAATPRRRRQPSLANPVLTSVSTGAEDDLLQADALYRAAACAAGSAAAETLRLDVWRVGARVQEAWAVGGARKAAQTADRWLISRFGRCDDLLRRALVASLALVLVPEAQPKALTALYPAAHRRLARSLSSAATYDPDFFGKDLAFGAGALAPAGALWISIPASRPTAAVRLVHVKKAAGLLWRMARTNGGPSPFALARDAGLKPWAELHVDTRTLREFHAEGFERTYRRLAALLRRRPDLAGVHGASWLYDPALEAISPGLGFIAEPARSGRAARVRLGVDPVQTAYAVSRSPLRRTLWLQGRYQPACYGLYWPRTRLLAWDAGCG